MKFQINKKLLLCILIFTLVIVLVVCILNLLNDEPIDENNDNVVSKTVVNIKEETINLIQYTNEDFSMKIPEGWMVETVPGNKYAIHVYNPNNSIYQMFLITSTGGFLKNAEAKQYYQIYSSVSENDLQKLPILNPDTPENLFKNWNAVVGFMKTNVNGFTNFNFPLFMNFNVKEHFALNSKLKENLGDKVTQAILRATFTSADANNQGEGLFSVSIVDLEQQNINFPLAIYNAMGISAPKGELINWIDILTQCLSSLKFSDDYLKKVPEPLVNINDEINITVTSYMTAWKSRQTNSDIQEQKIIDMNLNFERVYNVESGKVYRANKGWFAKYVGDDYKLITEDMYLLPLAGFVE